MSSNKKSNTLKTPMHLACINPNQKILEVLLKNGGETEYQDDKGRKPIHYSALCKGTGPLELLIKKKCNINDREKAGFTPLMHACRAGRYENVKILLENGADPLAKPAAGQSMGIHFACMKDTENNLKILKLLLQKNPELINKNGRYQKSPLHFAVIYNCPKIVEFLVKNGAKINKGDKYARSPLLLACKYGYSKIAKYLIDCGAKINKGDNSKNSPLHYASAFGNLECIKILLENGADINCLNMWNNIPLEIAMYKNHIGITKFLINDENFNVDTPFGNGNSLLFYYLLDFDKSTFEKIKFIIEDKKGNAKLANSNQMNAFHFLSCFTYRAYLSIFTSNEEKFEFNEDLLKNKYHQQFMKMLEKYVNFFKDKGCEPDLKNKIGQTPLMFALKNKNFEYGQILIETFKKKINIKHIDNNGFNIFDYAFSKGYSLTDECLSFIYSMFNIYKNEIDGKFLNQFTRYGRNALLNLCEDYALHIYEKLYFIIKNNYLKYEREFLLKKNASKFFLDDRKTIKISYEDLNKFVIQIFYPLIEEFIKRGADINCCTAEKQFINNDSKFEDYKYFNNYGKIYPIMYLIAYPCSTELIKMIKKHKININCIDLKKQTLLMYLFKVELQIRRISEDNYYKMYNFLIDNCNNLLLENVEGETLFYKEIESNNEEQALIIYNKLGKKNLDINLPYYDNLTLLGEAVINRDEDQIDFLLSNFKEINPNKINVKYNRNVLHYICMRASSKTEENYNEFLKWINLDTSLTQKDNYNRNPLFYLFIEENEDIKKDDPISILSFLLETYNNKNKKKFNIDSVDNLGNSLIFYAVKANATFCISSLLNYGAKINNIKNYANNSIFSYCMLYDSNSLSELYSKVNNVKVFEDKIYKENPIRMIDKPKEKIDKILGEESLHNNELPNLPTNKKVSNKNEIKFCVEEFFKSNYLCDYESTRDKFYTEKDNNLKQLFDENDEGENIEFLGNNYNDNDIYAGYWNVPIEENNSKIAIKKVKDDNLNDDMEEDEKEDNFIASDSSISVDDDFNRKDNIFNGSIENKNLKKEENVNKKINNKDLDLDLSEASSITKYREEILIEKIKNKRKRKRKIELSKVKKNTYFFNYISYFDDLIERRINNK